MRHEDFSVAKIVLVGPDGSSTSNRMSIAEAVAWLQAKSGYSLIQATMEAEVGKFAREVLAEIGPILDARIEKAKDALRAMVDAAEVKGLDKAATEVDRLRSEMEELKEELPWMLALARDVRQDRDDAESRAETKKRRQRLEEGLRAEMMVPGRRCGNHTGNCTNLLSEHGIAINPQYRGYVCGVCGQGGEGDKIIVLPEKPPLLTMKPAKKKARR